MIRRTILTIILATATAGAAQAACYADYKAKKTGPLQLHYGVVELPDNACGSTAQAEEAIAPRVARDGWTLLNVMSIFDESGLDERRASAGDYFLRY